MFLFISFNFFFFRLNFLLWLLIGQFLFFNFVFAQNLAETLPLTSTPQKTELQQPREVDSLTYKKGRIPVSYLGEDVDIKRHSKPLPYKQYDFIRQYPNTDAAVIYTAPETPLLKFDTKNPLEHDRMVNWLKEWDRISQNRSLVDRYQQSYFLKRDVDYLKKAFDLQKNVITDLASLKNISWPNSDYSFKAYAQIKIDCTIFGKILEYATEEDVSISDSKNEVCFEVD